MRAAILISLLTAGLVSFSQGSYIQAKAWLAQELIVGSWKQRDAQQAPAKPWPWFDSSVVGKLVLPSQAIEQYILADASGQSLAFGPGHLRESAPLVSAGHSVIAGHRDTHFAFLQHTKMNDVIELQHYTGGFARYRVVGLEVIDSSTQALPSQGDHSLSLVTCYPFNAITPGGSLRYVVRAERENT